MARKSKFSPAQIKTKVKEIQEVIEQQKRENKGEHFISLTREEIEKKLKCSNSPIITVQGQRRAGMGSMAINAVAASKYVPRMATWVPQACTDRQ